MQSSDWLISQFHCFYNWIILRHFMEYKKRIVKHFHYRKNISDWIRFSGFYFTHFVRVNDFSENRFHAGTRYIHIYILCVRVWVVRMLIFPPTIHIVFHKDGALYWRNGPIWFYGDSEKRFEYKYIVKAHRYSTASNIVTHSRHGHNYCKSNKKKLIYASNI